MIFEYNSKVPFDNDPFWQLLGNQLKKIQSEVRYVLWGVSTHINHYDVFGVPNNRDNFWNSLPYVGHSIDKKDIPEAIKHWFLSIYNHTSLAYDEPMKI